MLTEIKLKTEVRKRTLCINTNKNVKIRLSFLLFSNQSPILKTLKNRSIKVYSHMVALKNMLKSKIISFSSHLGEASPLCHHPVTPSKNPILVRRVIQR